MKYATDQNLNELVSVDELLDYYPIALRFHRFNCPNCGKRVIPVKAIQHSKHFKHKDQSADCIFYLGGNGEYLTPKKPLGVIASRNSLEIFQFIGFEKFSLEDTKFCNEKKLYEIPEIYHPDLFHNDYFLWIKPIDEFLTRSIDLNKFILNILIFSTYGHTVIIIINPAFRWDEGDTPNPVIETLINGSGVIFEMPTLSTLSLDMIKVWIFDTDGKIICPGRISLETLICETKFSYTLLKKIMKDLKQFFTKQPKEIKDSKHTFRNEDLDIYVSCQYCKYPHRIYVVINYDNELEVHFIKGIKTFTYIKHLGKFKCDQCGNFFFDHENMEIEWLKKYGDLQKEAKRKKLKGVLQSNPEDVSISTQIEGAKVKICLGEHMGDVGTVIGKDGINLKIKLIDLNEIIRIPEEFIICL